MLLPSPPLPHSPPQRAPAARCSRSHPPSHSRALVARPYCFTIKIDASRFKSSLNRVTCDSAGTSGGKRASMRYRRGASSSAHHCTQHGSNRACQPTAYRMQCARTVFMFNYSMLISFAQASKPLSVSLRTRLSSCLLQRQHRCTRQALPIRMLVTDHLWRPVCRQTKHAKMVTSRRAKLLPSWAAENGNGIFCLFCVIASLWWSPFFRHSPIQHRLESALAETLLVASCCPTVPFPLSVATAGRRRLHGERI